MPTKKDQKTLAEISRLHKLIDERNQEVGARELEITRLRNALLKEIDELNALHIAQTKHEEERHGRELASLRASVDEWRGRFSAAKLFISVLLKGEL